MIFNIVSRVVCPKGISIKYAKQQKTHKLLQIFNQNYSLPEDHIIQDEIINKKKKRSNIGMLHLL